MSPEERDRISQQNPNALVELESGLEVRGSVWLAFRTLAEVPEVGVPFIHQLVEARGSFQDAARWLDEPSGIFGQSPAQDICVGRIDLAQKELSRQQSKVDVKVPQWTKTTDIRKGDRIHRWGDNLEVTEVRINGNSVEIRYQDTDQVIKIVKGFVDQEYLILPRE